MDWAQVAVIIAPSLVVLGGIAYGQGMQRQELRGLKEENTADHTEIKSTLKEDRKSIQEVTMQLARMNGYDKGIQARKSSNVEEGG